MESTQTVPGVYRTCRTAGDRRLQFYAIEAGEEMVLFDAGLPGDVTEWTRVFRPPRVNRIIISHADADHFGGAGDFARDAAWPQVLAHEADRAWIESPELLIAERYGCARDFGVGYDDSELAALLRACGGGVRLDATLADGEELRIGDKTWTVLHVPGHSPGHIALWQPSSRTLLLGDAALGFGVPDVGGGISMPPTHQFIDDYLTSLERLALLEPDLAFTGHWLPMNRETFSGLIRESRECVDRDLAFLRSVLRGRSHSFCELLAELNGRFRKWPQSADIHYFYALLGYLRFLAGRGEISFEQNILRRN